MLHKKTSPVAIGGLGGSGTRVFSKLLALQGFFMGSDLNESEDNLAFTLFFKRRSALIDDANKFNKLAEMFFSSLSGDQSASISDRDLIFSLADDDRMGHSREWLRERAQQFFSEKGKTQNSRWGWKEPNTHLLIDRLLPLNDRLKYIHVLRDPYCMAFSKNQNQLKNWGGVFFDKDLSVTPRNAFAFWRSVHSRITVLAEVFSGRILFVRYEDMLSKPESVLERIGLFLNSSFDPCVLDQLGGFIRRPPAVKDSPAVDLSEFNQSDVDYVKKYWDGA